MIPPELRKRINEVIEEYDVSEDEKYALKNHTHNFIVGPEGAPGQKGDRGPKGEKGDTGDRGARGEQGFQGIPGRNGEKGITGDRGPPGVRGDRGPVGAKGDPGEIKVYVVFTSNPSWADDKRIHPEIIRLIREKEKEYTGGNKG